MSELVCQQPVAGFTAWPVLVRAECDVATQRECLCAMRPGRSRCRGAVVYTHVLERLSE
ncbi:MAG TPA: hypothetical protein VNM90_25205 [Haliangium sp.]|nr:hypothetical protein [Haliangium sp.]